MPVAPLPHFSSFFSSYSSILFSHHFYLQGPHYPTLTASVSHTTAIQSPGFDPAFLSKQGTAPGRAWSSQEIFPIFHHNTFPLTEPFPLMQNNKQTWMKFYFCSQKELWSTVHHFAQYLAAAVRVRYACFLPPSENNVTYADVLWKCIFQSKAHFKMWRPDEEH